MVPESMNESIGMEVSCALEGDNCVLCALSCVVAVNDNVRMINVLHNPSVTSDLEFLSLKPAQNKKGRPLAVLASCHFVVCVLIIYCLLLSISPLIPGAHLPLSFRCLCIDLLGPSRQTKGCPALRRAPNPQAASAFHEPRFATLSLGGNFPAKFLVRTDKRKPLPPGLKNK